MIQNLLKTFAIGLLLTSSFVSAEGILNSITTLDLPKGLSPKDQTQDPEIISIDNLISVTEKNLEAQKTLRSMLVEYQKMKIASLKDSKNKDQIDALVKKALEIQTLIQNNHLSHVFDPQFLSELNLFSQIASKPGLPPPNQK